MTGNRAFESKKIFMLLFRWINFSFSHFIFLATNYIVMTYEKQQRTVEE